MPESRFGIKRRDVGTLADARTILARYGGQGNSFTERLNMVIARLLPEANSRGTKVPVRFPVYIDAMGNRIVTLPRGLETILAGAYQAPSPDVTGPGWWWCGDPIPIRNNWYEFSASGPGDFAGSDWQRGIIRLNGRFTTFLDWDVPKKLRIKTEQTEINGKMVIRGSFEGKKYWSTFDDGWNEGVQLTFTNTTVTTTQLFDTPPYELIKTVTKGRIRFYAVDPDTDDELLCGYYDPDETNPSYARFKVPVCEATGP